MALAGRTVSFASRQETLECHGAELVVLDRSLATTSQSLSQTLGLGL